MKNLCKLLLALLLSAGIVYPSFAERASDGLINKSYAALKGKTVAYIPIAMNYDLGSGWAAGLQREAHRLGYKVIIRDPNWSNDNFVQAMQAVVRLKPDVIVIQPPDITTLSRGVKQAQAAGIPVVEMNQMTSAVPNVFVGADWYSIGLENAASIASKCGTDGRSNNVAIIEGVVTATASASEEAGIRDGLKSYPKIKVVAAQAALWNASKSNAIATTVVKQHPNLCGIFDVWDGQATGAATAIAAAGKAGKILLATSGGGQAKACQQVANGSFDFYVSSDLANEVRAMNTVVKTLLQSKPGPTPYAIYQRNKLITKANLRPDSCWTVPGLLKYDN